MVFISGLIYQGCLHSEKHKNMGTFRIILILAFTLVFLPDNFAQDLYRLKDAQVSFFSSAPLEDIQAMNKMPAGIIDFKASRFSFKLNMKDFIFHSSLMQEHFSENYLESEKFPSSTYKGNIIGEMDLKKDGQYKVITKGDLTIHGVTKPVEIPVILIVKGTEITFQSDFKVTLKDYDIEIPSVVFEKIAEVVDVNIQSSLILVEKK